MKIIAYWLAKSCRKFKFKIEYYKHMRTIEITLPLWNILIFWGKDVY